MSDSTPCGWCALRAAVDRIFATPTCESCKDGGRHRRVLVYLQRLRFNAERTRA